MEHQKKPNGIGKGKGKHTDFNISSSVNTELQTELWNNPKSTAVKQSEQFILCVSPLTHINRERETTQETLLCRVHVVGAQWLNVQTLRAAPFIQVLLHLHTRTLQSRPLRHYWKKNSISHSQATRDPETRAQMQADWTSAICLHAALKRKQIS